MSFIAAAGSAGLAAIKALGSVALPLLKKYGLTILKEVADTILIDAIIDYFVELFATNEAKKQEELVAAHARELAQCLEDQKLADASQFDVNAFAESIRSIGLRTQIALSNDYELASLIREATSLSASDVTYYYYHGKLPDQNNTNNL